MLFVNKNHKIYMPEYKSELQATHANQNQCNPTLENYCSFLKTEL